MPIAREITQTFFQHLETGVKFLISITKISAYEYSSYLF